MCPCSLQLNCCGMAAQGGVLCGADCAGFPCLVPPHRLRELEKVMTEADNSKMQAWGQHFLGRTLPPSKSPGCVHFMAAVFNLDCFCPRFSQCWFCIRNTHLQFPRGGASAVQQECCWIAVIVAILNLKSLPARSVASCPESSDPSMTCPP